MACRARRFDEVKHHQRILKILSQTDRIMRTIDLELSKSSATDEEVTEAGITLP